MCRMDNSVRARVGKDHGYISNQPSGFQVNQAEAAALNSGKSLLGFAKTWKRVSSAPHMFSGTVQISSDGRRKALLPPSHSEEIELKGRQSLKATAFQIIFYPGCSFILHRTDKVSCEGQGVTLNTKKAQKGKQCYGTRNQ